MKFNKDEHRALHLGRSSPMHKLRADLLEGSSVEKDLRVPADNRMTMSHRCVPEGQWYSGMHQEKCGRHVK